MNHDINDPDILMERFRDDFELWALKCVKIIDKDSKQLIPFVPNAPQRRLLAFLEERRRLGVPVRIIMLKARQWGGSTLVQLYFAWIQIVHRCNWHSIICAHNKDTASAIRGMYSRLLANYPREYWPGEGKPVMRPYEGSANSRVIPDRGCVITVASSENQDSSRGMDYSMAHLSEVAFWKKSTLHDPMDVIRSISAGIARHPYTIVVLESTANGVGSYFHREWLRASQGESDKEPFFVPWFEIERYREHVSDPEEFSASLSPYESMLHSTLKAPLEAVKWFRGKSREYQDRRSMNAEYPSTPQEAFAESDLAVFSTEAVGRLRDNGCSLPCQRGEIDFGAIEDLSSARFASDTLGDTLVWRHPVPGASYVAALDIGGRSLSADFSVISVVGAGSDGKPEVVAQWRGHLDHDLLAWKAAAVAAYYNCALLAIESNSWESSARGNNGQFILNALSEYYPNLYRRKSAPLTPGGEVRFLPGFHTNSSTKQFVINNLIRMVRDGGYTEHFPGACDELLQYEQKPGGSFGARDGCHDDILMSRAIALWIYTSDNSSPSGTPGDLSTFYSQL